MFLSGKMPVFILIRYHHIYFLIESFYLMHVLWSVCVCILHIESDVLR